MLKKEQEIELCKKYLCINPYCQQPQERLCHSSSHHFNAHQCAKWIIDTTNLQIIEPAPFTTKELNNIEINFSEEPLKSMHLVDKLRHSEWNKWLTTQMNRFKKELNIALETQFESLAIQIEEFISNCPQKNQIYKIIQETNNLQSAINQFYQQNRPKPDSVENIVLFNKAELKEISKNVKQQIRKIFETLYSTKNKNEVSIKGDQKAFHSYMFEPIDAYYNKLQVLSSALNRQVTTYTLKGEIMSLECILCEKKVSSRVHPISKKTVKKELAEQILTHLYCSHHQQVYFAYNHKIIERTHPTLTFEELLDVSKTHEKIRLIDRESGINFEQNYADFTINKNTYTVEILSPSNPHMIKGAHLFVPSHETVELMIAIIAYVCSQRDQEIVVLTKRLTFKKALDQLIDMKPSAKSECVKIKQE